MNADVVAVRDGNERLARLESGFADAFASDRIKLAGLAAQSRAPEKFAMLPEDLSFEPYALRCRAGMPRCATRSSVP